MSATDVHDTSRDASVGRVDMKLEVMIIPVSDVETLTTTRAMSALPPKADIADFSLSDSPTLRVLRFC